MGGGASLERLSDHHSPTYLDKTGRKHLPCESSEARAAWDPAYRNMHSPCDDNKEEYKYND